MNTRNKLNDPDLPEEEQDALIGAFVRQQERERLRARWAEQLATEHGVRREGKAPEAQVRRSPLRKIVFGALAAAAAVLLLIFALPLLNNAASADRVLASAEEVLTMTGERGNAETTLDSLRNALVRDYEGENFPAATRTADALAELAGITPTDRLYIGYAYQKADGFSAAEAIFRDLLTNEPGLASEARYALALSLLSQERTAEAVELLKVITPDNDGTRIYGKATDLLAVYGE